MCSDSSQSNQYSETLKHLKSTVLSVQVLLPPFWRQGCGLKDFFVNLLVVLPQFCGFYVTI